MDTQNARAASSGIAGFVRDSTVERELLTVVGDIDPVSESEFGIALGECLVSSRNIVVDLRFCNTIGSLGLTALMKARHYADCNFTVVATPGGIVQRVFEICNLEEALGVRYDKGLREL